MAKSTHKVSVVIPAHNVERWILESLSSVAAQTFQPSEIIVVVDSSDDSTFEVAKESGIPSQIVSVDFGNAAKARNFGVQLASGAGYVAFLDGDDRWRPDHLERFQVSIGNGDVAYFAHHDAFFDASGEYRGRKPLREEASGGLDDALLLDYFVGKNHGWPTSGMIVERGHFLERGGFDEEQVRRHDAEMFMRIVKGRTWAYGSAVTWEYRLNREGNISGNLVACAPYMLRALNKIYALYQDPRLKEILSLRSRQVLSYMAREDDQNKNPEVFDLALSHVPMFHRVFYRSLASMPALSRWFLECKTRFAR